MEPGRTDAEKRESQERVQAASRSKADVDGAAAQDAIRALHDRIARGGQAPRAR